MASRMRARAFKTALEKTQIMEKYNNPRGWLEQSKIVKRLVDEGINLDRISEGSLNVLVAENLKNTVDFEM